MNPESGKNINNASIDANGNVVFGDGNHITVINLKEAAQYKKLQTDLEELDGELETIKERINAVPDYVGFKQDLLRVDKKRQLIREEMDNIKEYVLSLAEDFSKISINTDRLRLAKAYFVAGEFQQARAILNADVLDMELGLLKAEEEKLNQKLSYIKEQYQNKANEYLILARLTAFDFNNPNRLDDTIGYFNKSLSSERNSDNIFAFAKFLQDHHQLEEAKPLYEEALIIQKKIAITKPKVILTDVVLTLNHFGHLLLTQNSPDRAEEIFREALEILNEFSDINHKDFLPNLAMTVLS